MSENITYSAVEPPAEPPVEITEITREAILPDSRFIPMKCGWAPKEMMTYNRDALNPPQTLFRLRERDCFVFGNGRVMVSIGILDYGFCGAVCVTLVDCAEGRERSQTKLIPFCMGSIILPVTSSTGDVVFRSEDVSLDFLRAPDKWYIRLYFDRFDDVRSLYINASAEDVGGDSAFSSMPVGKRGNHFLLRHNLFGMPVTGKAVLGGGGHAGIVAHVAAEFLLQHGAQVLRGDAVAARCIVVNDAAADGIAPERDSHGFHSATPPASESGI